MIERRATPMFRAFLVPKTLLGTDRRLTILNMTLGLSMVLGPGLWWWIGLTAVFQAVMRWMTERDPHLLAVYTRYEKEGDVYDPFPRAFARRNVRPEGFGRSTLC